MAAFTLDTSGVVEGPITTPDGGRYAAIGWAFLSPFAQGYVEALFESGIDWPDVPWPRPGGEPLGFSDLAPETLAAILKDCEAFGQTWRVLEPERGFATGVQGGRDFWWLRNNRALTQPPFPPLTPFLDDEGKVRLREAG